ncbi:MAG: ATP-binding protein [Thermodesulfobacteriota bacterium]|nr:ATP-binding protein [Thermodesulfobacteriota bacterium]
MNILRIIRQWPASFSGRIFISLFLTMLTLALLFNMLFIDLQKQLLTEHTISEGKGQAELLAYTVRLGVFAENKEQLRLPVEAILAQKDVLRVAIFNNEGKMLFALEQQENDPTEPLPAPDICLIPPQQNIDSTQVTIHENGFCFRAPVTTKNTTMSTEELFFEPEDVTWAEEIIGSVQIVISKDRLTRGIKTILTRNFILAAIFLALAAVTTFIIVKQATRPMEELLIRVKKKAGITEQSQDLDLLNKTFTSLIEELHNSFRTITKLKLNLEEKVEERTAQLSQRHMELVETNQKLTKTLTELKEAQSHLVQSEKMASLGQLVAGVAHEINNTTNFITGALPSLKRLMVGLETILSHYEDLAVKHGETVKGNTEKDDHDYKKILADVDILLDNISKGARRTGNIVRELRQFSRLDEERKKRMDIHGGLESTLTFIYPQYRNRIEIIKNYDETLAPVTCMPGKINQVFTNLLTNSMQAIPEKGLVTIQTRQDYGRIHIIIKDSGSGIAPENLDRIFDPFFTTKEPGVGTGLGLSISYTIIKEHHGEILVKSEKDNGTEFEIILPVNG